MKNQISSDILPENTELDLSREKVIKLILKNLIDRYSLIKIINDIVSVTKKNENQIILKNKIPLGSEDIIAIIYKNIGSVKLYQCLLDLNPINKGNNIHIKKKSSKQKIKKEKFIKYPNIKSKIMSLNAKKSHQSNTNNSLNNNMIDDVIMIDLNNSESDEEEKYDNKNIISLYENENTIYEKKEGKKTEEKINLKKKKKKKMKNKTKSVSVSLHDKGIYSEIKFVNVKKKLGNIIYQNKLGFHYILEKGNIYKFKVKNVVDDKEVALFICDDIYCKAVGEYSINNNSFKTIKDHNISRNEHGYNKYMSVQDMNILSYMIDNKIEDLQLTKV